MATIDPITGMPSSNVQQLQAGDMPTPPTPKGMVTSPYTGFTSSQAPATVTTPVVSSLPAKEKVGEISNVLTSAQKSIADLQAKKNITTIDKKTKADGTSELYMSDGTRVKTDAQGNVMPQTSPEQQIADTPDTGYKFVYNPSSGDRTQIPLNESASAYGMVDNNPTVAPIKPVLASADLPSGTSVKQYQDGTYGLYDVSGKYIGNATQTQFKNAQNGQDVLDKLNQAVNGNYPLTASQNAQIDSVKALYSNLIKEQEKANTNFTGGTTVAQNLYGIGNTQMGAGQIKGVVDAGVAKIADIQSRMNSDVAKMTMAFQEGNLSNLKDAYAAFSNNAKELQSNIDKTHDDVASIIKADKAQQAAQQLAIDNDINTLATDIAKSGGPDNPVAYQEALANKDYSGMIKAAGRALADASNVELKNYNKYVDDLKVLHPGAAPLEFSNPSAFNDYRRYEANLKAKASPGNTTIINAAGTTSNGQYKSDLDALIGNAQMSIGTKFGQQAFANAIKSARTDADKIRTLATLALKNSPAPIREDFVKQSQSITSIDKAIEMLDTGVKTGVFQAGTQYTYNLAGKDYDPKLAKLNQQITSAIQPYRNSITGAAWGNQEDGEYQQLFGSTKYSPTELKQRLVGLKEIMKEKSITALSAEFDPFGTASNPYSPVAQAQAESGANFDSNLSAMKTTNPTIFKAASNMYTSVNPKTKQPYTHEEILQAFPELGQ